MKAVSSSNHEISGIKTNEENLVQILNKKWRAQGVTKMHLSENKH